MDRIECRFAPRVKGLSKQLFPRGGQPESLENPRLCMLTTQPCHRFVLFAQDQRTSDLGGQKRGSDVMSTLEDLLKPLSLPRILQAS